MQVNLDKWKCWLYLANVNTIFIKFDPFRSRLGPVHTVCLLLKLFFKISESAIATQRAFRAHFILRHNDAILVWKKKNDTEMG